MEELLPHLAGLGVAQVWLEARTASLNAKDRAHIKAMRGRQLLTTALRIDVARPCWGNCWRCPMRWRGAGHAAGSGAAAWTPSYG